MKLLDREVECMHHESVFVLQPWNEGDAYISITSFLRTDLLNKQLQNLIIERVSNSKTAERANIFRLVRCHLRGRAIVPCILGLWAKPVCYESTSYQATSVLMRRDQSWFLGNSRLWELIVGSRGSINTERNALEE